MQLLSVDSQYMNLLAEVYHNGVDIYNPRTDTHCRTVIDRTITIPPESDGIITSRKINTDLTYGEMIGYLNGYTDAKDFDRLGAKSWYSNANETRAWVNNPHRKGDDDMGLVYGAVARNWPKWDGTTIDLVKEKFEALMCLEDDRDLTITFYNPGMFELGCLRPCMHTHQFSIVGDTLYLSSTQRSADMGLGVPHNIGQVAFLRRLGCEVTGLKPGNAKLRMINCHLYDNQLEAAELHLQQIPSSIEPRLVINKDINTLDDILSIVPSRDIVLEDYRPAGVIAYPFTS